MNYPIAIENFENFLSKANGNNKYSVLVQRTEEYIYQLEKDMSETQKSENRIAFI